MPPLARSRALWGGVKWAQCRSMMSFTDLASISSSDRLAPLPDQLRLAVAGYLARFKGASRQHTESDLRCFLYWCAGCGLDPLAARRPHLELYIRWMQEARHFKPSTVSRRVSVVAGFYKTCVIDGALEHSPAEHVRRPVVPPESPTLGFTHLQFEALLTAARDSANPYDFALVAMLGLLGLRIFEATGADIADLGEEHGHRVLRVRGKGTKVVLIPLPPAVGRAIDWAARHPELWADLVEQPRRPDGPPRRDPPPAAPGRRCGCTNHQGAPAESARGAVPVLPPARFPGPLAEPAVPVSRQRALHGCCHQAGFAGGHGDGILFPR